MNTEQWYDRLYKQPTCSCSSPERIWAIRSSKALSLKSKTLQVQTHLKVKYCSAVVIHISGLPSCTLYLKLEQDLATACTSCVLTTPRTWKCDWGVRESDNTWNEQLTSRCWSLLIFWRDWDNISISCKSSLFVFAPKRHLPPSQTHKGDRHGSSNRAIPELKISSYILKVGKLPELDFPFCQKNILLVAVRGQQTNMQLISMKHSISILIDFHWACCAH